MGEAATRLGSDVATAGAGAFDASFDSSFSRAILLLQGVTARDGALTVLDKQLLTVALSAVRDPDRCAAAAERALGSGVPVEHVHALALALYLSRGEPPARALLAAVARPEPSTGAVAPLASADIVAEFAAVFGEVPARVRLLEEYAPDALEAYHRMRVAVLRDGPLAPLLGELVLFAVNAAEHRADFAEVHARGARRAGADDAALVEAGLTAVAFGGVAAWLAASEAIVATQPEGAT